MKLSARDQIAGTIKTVKPAKQAFAGIKASDVAVEVRLHGGFRSAAAQGRTATATTSHRLTWNIGIVTS